MKTYCKYHPTRPARWYCEKCQTNYCPDCIAKRVRESYGTKETFHMCPKCNVEAKSLGVGNMIVPFWNRLPQFFLYPFHPRPLLLIVLVAAADALLSDVFLLGFMVRIASWGIVLKYAFAVLRSTAQGDLRPPKIDSDTIAKDFHQVFKQIALFVVVGIAFVAIFQTAGVIVGIAFLAFVILSVPAMIIILVVSDSVIQAVNPMLFVRMAWRIGWSYLLMYFFLVLLGGGRAVLARYAVQFLQPGLLQFFVAIVEGIFTVVSYSMMGYLILQYHEEIGYKVEDLVEERAAAPDKSPEEQILGQIDIMIKDGQIDAAIDVIKNKTNGSIRDVRLSERYYDLLKLSQRTSEMLAHGGGFLDLLVKADDKEKAVEVYGECGSKDPKFAPAPGSIFRIAAWLNEDGDVKGAINAYDRFVKANPKSPLVPKAYFLAAQLLSEKLKKHRAAADILMAVAKTYPHHDIIPHVNGYLQKITSGAAVVE